MGCARSSNDLPHASAEESLIIMHERDLGLQQHSSALIEAQIRRVSQTNGLSSRQLDRLANFLDLDLRPLKDSATPVASFYASLRKDNSYDTDSLVVLGILLGSSSSKAKSLLLSDLADPNASSFVEEAELVKVLTDIAAISVDCLPLLAMQNDLDMHIKALIEKLSSFTSSFVAAQASLMLKGRPSMPCKEFRSLLDSQAHIFWLTPVGVRYSLLNWIRAPSINTSYDN
jgi:hypothetical protein